jgi:hypothetical protein
VNLVGRDFMDSLDKKVIIPIMKIIKHPYNVCIILLELVAQ